MVPPGTKVELDETTAESLIRSKLAEEIKSPPPPPLPKAQTPKQRYLDPPDPGGDKDA
jgi:hypothetical protein